MELKFNIALNPMERDASLAIKQNPLSFLFVFALQPVYLPMILCFACTTFNLLFENFKV